MSDLSSAISADNLPSTSAVGLNTNLSPHREKNVRTAAWIHGEERALHLPDALIHFGVPRELFHMTGGKFKHADITLLGRYSRLDNVDFTLSCDSLRFNLLD